MNPRRYHVVAAASLLGSLALVGCQTSQVLASKGSPDSGRTEAVVQGDSAVISVVRNGVLRDFNSTTVGKAFDGTFQNAKWTSFETPKGATVVQFDGTITVGVLEGAKVYTSAKFAVGDRCIESLGLKSKMKEEAQAIQKAEEQYSATMRSFEERSEDVRRKFTHQYYRSQTDEERAQDEELKKLKAEEENLNRERIATDAAAVESVKGPKQLLQASEDRIETCVKTTPIPVSFQFLLSVDKKTFEINYVDKQVFDANEAKALEFIYR